MDPNQDLIEFWKDVVLETKLVNNPIFLDCLQSIDANRVWNVATDENLKSFLTTVNRLSSEAKSRSLGLTLLNQFVEQISSDRFLVIQESLGSALHIAVKFIDQELVQRLFANLLPRCRETLELNQIMSSSILPKILTNLSSIRPKEMKRSLSLEEIKLLRVCLEHFHGPCGNHRNNFEKTFLPYIDSDNLTERSLVFKIIPLLSATGSGGTKRAKHGQDWYAMNVKILHAMHNTVLMLYADASSTLEEFNPYDTEFGTLDLPSISEKNVFLRYSLLKNRLTNLAALLGCYLSESFPVPKSVPSRSILNIVCKMLLLNPVDILKKGSPREFIYLSGILPIIHEAALGLLSRLINCVGSNLFPESERIEQISLQELKWLSKSPKSYKTLKISMYQMLLKWIEISNGSVTSNKTLSTWLTQIQKDVCIEKTSTTLSLKSWKSKSGNKKKVNSTLAQSSSSMLTSSERTTVLKDPQLCAAALDFLDALIPSLDPTLYRTAYQLIAKTIMEFSQTPALPSPYNRETCRVKMLQCALTLALNPHPRAPISLGVLINLARECSSDPRDAVVEVCRQLHSCVEKLVHPAIPSFEFPSVFNPEETTQEFVSVTSDGDMQVSDSVDTRESFSQTEAELSGTPTLQQLPTTPTIAEIPESLSLTIKSTIQKEIQQLFAELPHHFERQSQSISEDRSTTPEHNLRVPSQLVNGHGHGKRSAEVAVSSHDKTTDRTRTGTDEVTTMTTKRLRIEEDEVEPVSVDCSEWINDFVDLSPSRE